MVCWLSVRVEMASLAAILGAGDEEFSDEDEDWVVTDTAVLLTVRAREWCAAAELVRAESRVVVSPCASLRCRLKGQNEPVGRDETVWLLSVPGLLPVVALLLPGRGGGA